MPKLKKPDVDHYLKEYQSKYGPESPDPIVTGHQGKLNSIDLTSPMELDEAGEEPVNPKRSTEPSTRPNYPTRAELIKACHLKPKSTVYFQVETPELDDVILFLLRNQHYDLLNDNEWSTLSGTSKSFNTLFKRCNQIRRVNFEKLTEPRLQYAKQDQIDSHRVEMADACFLHYGGEVGSVIRYCGGEFTAAHRDPAKLLNELQPHIPPEDLKHIERIMTEGCPAAFAKAYDKQNKIKMLERGNGTSLQKNVDAVITTMNKEDKNSHVIPVSSIFVRFTAYAHHVAQTLNTKKENARMCWDGTNKDHPEDWAVNDDVDMENEPQITFGSTMTNFLSLLWNERIMWPNEEILIAAADIKACFRWPKLHPDAAGAFCFNIAFMGLFFLSTAMVFGFRASSNSWEPFRRAIETMAAVYFAQGGDQLPNYDKFIDMVTLQLPQPNTIRFTKAKPCSINKGNIDDQGNHLPPQPKIYVDDALICAVWFKMTLALRALLHAIFKVCGEPAEHLRQCPLALDKWKGMLICYRAILLGLIIDTRAMTVGITEEYIEELHKLLCEKWHTSRRSFYLNELEQLLGKCARLGEGASWTYHLLSHMYRSTAFAIKSNREHLAKNSPSFMAHIKRIKQLRQEHTWETRKSIAHINFALKKSAQMVHRVKEKYYINSDMRAEIEFLRQATAPNSNVSWSTPIGHMVKRDPNWQCHSDACLRSGGGYSIDLNFIWYLQWPQEFVKRTLLFLKNDRNNDFISINIFEFISVILNYCAAWTAILADGKFEDPFPVLLAWCDNTSAVRWITHAAIGSAIGRALGRLFCALLINSPLGINARWLSTTDNEIADEISRLKNLTLDSDINWSNLFQSFPQLETCRTFHPSNELVSCLWHCLSTKSCPDLDRIEKLKQAGLGKLNT